MSYGNRTSPDSGAQNESNMETTFGVILGRTTHDMDYPTVLIGFASVAEAHEFVKANGLADEDDRVVYVISEEQAKEELVAATGKGSDAGE